MSLKLDIGARFLSAFGVDTNTVNPEIMKNNHKYNIAVYDKSDQEYQKNIFVFNGKKLVFNSMLTENSSVFAPPLLVDFYKEKNLITTKVKGSDNVVVERWGSSPWQMEIQGILIDTENRFYPTSKIEQLVELFDFNGVIEVIGDQFYDKGIDSIYFNSVSITGLEGFADTIQFSISAQSQKAVNYTLLNPIQ